MLCLSGFEVYSRWVPLFVYSRQQGLVVQTLDSAIQRIYRYPDDSVIEIRNTYPAG